MPFKVSEGDIVRVKISWQNIHFIVSFVGSKKEVALHEKERNIFN
jgi:hypothetical protein